MMEDKIEFIAEPYGTNAIIKVPWEGSFIELLKEKGIKGLELNQGKGWYGENVDFLEMFPELRVLKILDFQIDSILPIHSLAKLEEVYISTYCKTPIDFNCFPNLLRCGLEWRKKSESIFEVKGLNKLFINKYDGDGNLFSKLTNLKELSILNSKIDSLNFLRTLVFLERLRIGNLKNIISLSGVEHLQNLTEIKVQSCKRVKSISEIFLIRNLKRLIFIDGGTIDTFNGIEKLINLEGLFFSGSTKVLDGNLNPLFQLNKLNNISFMNRRHYTHKREDFGKIFHSGIH